MDAEGKLLEVGDQLAHFLCRPDDRGMILFSECIRKRGGAWILCSSFSKPIEKGVAILLI